MTLQLAMEERTWHYAEPFVIARTSYTRCDGLDLTLTDAQGRRGRSESYGIPYAGETPASMRAAIDAVADRLCAGIDRHALLDLLPLGGARCAVDLALWDLEAKQGRGDPFSRSGVTPGAVVTAYTIGIRSLEAYEQAGAQFARCPWLKIKVNADDPLAAVAAVRRRAPLPRLIVDPNEAWSVAQLRLLAPDLVRLGVDLLEQPFPAGAEAELDGYHCPIPLCADEALDDIDGLEAVSAHYQVVNIKLDKAGGLTAALLLADAAKARGLDRMIGCMGGSSLAMAPGMVVAQGCRYVDLDGPRLLTGDRTPAFAFEDGTVPVPHLPALWG